MQLFSKIMHWKWLHRCWWRMLKTKYVGDNFEMLVTVVADFVTNILYLLALASGTNIQKMSPISKFCHQHPKIVTNIKPPTSTCHQHLCSLMHIRQLFTILNEFDPYLSHISPQTFSHDESHMLKSAFLISFVFQIFWI